MNNSHLVLTDSNRIFRGPLLSCGAIAVLALVCVGCGRNKSTPAGAASTPKAPSRPAAAGAERNRVTPAVAPLPGEQQTNPSDATTQTAASPPGQPVAEPVQPLFRPSDSRPRHDDAKVKQAGIGKYVSRRLVLYTDMAPEAARPLPPLMDRAYEAWEAYFGPLPSDRERTDFQMTGYIMVDRQRFISTGMLPEDLPGFQHGRHRGAEFWMNDQPTDYYRRHLMLHEGTHCFMTIVPQVLQPFVWYMEGMAELFGTHASDDRGGVQFRVLPEDKDRFQGLGRIRLIEDDVRQGALRDVESVMNLQPQDFLKNEAYAWSWALCKFLDTHPRYRERFRHVVEHVSAGRQQTDFRKLFAPDWADLCEEWLLFAAHLCDGYDIERAAIEFKTGRPLGAMNGSAGVEIAADRGWQSTGVLVEKGRAYHITAAGRFTVAQQPKPWECEPQGVSIRYMDGKPLGLLIACIRGATPVTKPTKPPHTTMFDVIPLGRDRTFTAPVTGTLHVRVNEFWNELADNTGNVRVVIRETASEAPAPSQ